MIERLFAKQHKNFRRRRVSRHDQRSHTAEVRLDIQPLEERLALAIDLFQYPVAGVTSGASNYAILLMDDGTNGFLKKNATPLPSFTYATNSQFLDDPLTPDFEAITFGELLAAAGPLESFYVTSGVRETYVGPAIPATSLGTSVFFVNVGDIDLGSSDGIVPGTFSGAIDVVDADGKSASALILASKPGNTWNLSFLRTSGDGALPTEGDINEFTGDVVLRGWTKAPLSVDLLPNDWGVYTGPPNDSKPLSFTLFPGQTVTQRFVVDLSRNESSISLNSPLLATAGKAGDPAFFSAAPFGGQNIPLGNVGQVALYATSISLSVNVSSASLFTAGVLPWFTATPVPTSDVVIERPVSAQTFQLLVEGSPADAGRLLIGDQGALSRSLTTPDTAAAGTLDVQATHADVVFAGIVNAAQQTYLLQSPLDTRAYSLTTVSPTAGVQTGRIIGDTVGITLANDAGGDVDVRTTINNLRMTASSTPSAPVLPYAIRIHEADDLVIDAVPASERAIAFTADGKLSLTSSIQTTGDLALVARNELKLSAPISSATGSIVMVSDSVTSNSTVTAGGIRGVTFTSLSSTGDVDVNALVRAGGLVKQPVKAATVADIVRSGPQTIDGVALVTGDRVLVKNQTIPSENGIYVVAAGAWTRASDANLSVLFVPGFSVYVTDGTQRGGWAFANPTSPSLNTTGLLFVPVSATQAYAAVAAATTGNISSLSGLLTIDDVPLLAGERVLVKDQTNKRQNGIYVVSAGAWQRAGDADTAAELRAGSYVFVEPGGTANGSKSFVLDDDAVQVGVTQLNFSPFAVQTTRTNTYSPANVLASVVAATTANIDLSVAPTTIDGQSLATNDLVLVKNQISAAQNGVYQVQAGGVLARWTGADSAGELARGTTVYVTGGAVNGTTSWTFNDTDAFLGSITAGNQVVTGLVSTSRLAIGMLVTGPGIPSGTTISGINSSTSIRLSKPVNLTDPSVALSFMDVSAVAVGTTPIVFAPTGGAVVITAGSSVTSTAATPTSRLQGATALLSGGRPQSGTVNTASAITANTNVGRLSAGAPAAIAIDNSNAVDLVRIGTSKAGPIAVTASGTLTALDVLATGTTGIPGTVTLLSTFGNVVAAGVTSTLGDVSLTAATGDVRVTQVTSLGSPASTAGNTYAGNVIAQAGSVMVTANESPGSTTGDIVIDGRLVSDGAGSDIILKTSVGGVTFTSTAFVNAKDQLLINTPQSEVTVKAGAQIAASRLSLTAELGAGTSPPAALGNYPSIFINRTDAGDIVYTTTSSLTIEGAVTKDGSIAFTAPDITVAGDILPNGATKEIALHATAGDLKIDAALTASGNIRLKAPAGEISNSAGTTTPLLSSPLSLFVEAATGAYLATKVTSLDATLSGIGAVLEVTETDSLVIERVLLSGGGTADLKIGSPAAGGSATVKSIDVGATTGTLKLLANENIVEGGTPAVADIVANRAELTATLGKIDVDTDVNVLLASATQKSQAITIDDLGVSGLELQSVQTNNADIEVRAKGGILASSVITAGKILLATSDAGADIVVGNLVATINTITLAARGSILEATPADPSADITATTVSLTATDGSIDVHLDASAVAATANTVGSFIKIKDDNSLSIGNLTDGISGKSVSITVGGGLTQTKAIVAESLSVTSTAGAVTLDTVANNVNSLTVNNGNRAVSFQDVDGLDIGAAGITGGVIALKVGGNLTQTGAINGASLAVTSTAGAVTLDTVANNVNSLTMSGTDAVSFRDADGLDVGAVGITGTAIALNVGGALTQTGAINGASLAVTSTAGVVTLANAANNVNSLTVSGTAAVSFQDAGPLQIGAAGVTGTDSAGGFGVDIKAASLTVGNPVTSGTAGAGNGNIRLTATAGNITLSGAVSAPDDTIVLDASNGLITQTAPALNCATLVWFANVTPTLLTSPPNIFSAVAPNLTAPGNLTIPGSSFIGTLTIVGASTVDGSIFIEAGGVVIVDLVKAGGLNNQVTVTATTGDIQFQSAGQITNAQGDVVLTANNGAVTAANTTSLTTVAGDELTISAKSTSALKTAVASVSGNITSGDLTLTEANALEITGLTASNITLNVGGPLTQTGAINGVSLAVTSTAGVVTLNTVANNVNSLTVSGIDAVSFQDADGLDVGVAGITGTAIALKVGGALTQTGAINGASLAVTSTAGVVTLTNAANNVNSLTVSGTDAVSFQDADGLDVGIAGITGTAIALNVGGALTQTGTIVGTSLTASSDTGVVSLTNPDNDVNSLTVNNGNRNVSFTDKDELTVNAITGYVIALTVGGDLTQTGPVTGFLLAVTASAGSVTLNNANNDIDWLTITNSNRAVSFTDKNAFAVGGNGVTGGDIVLRAGSTLAQTVAIVGTSLTASSDTGVVSLTNPDNDVNSLTVNNGNRNVSFTDKDELTVNAITGAALNLRTGGNLAVSGIVNINGNVTITTTAGGGVDVGPIPNSLLKAGGTLDLRNVQGQIGMRNNGRIEGSPVLVVPGTIINVGGTITTANDLDQSVATINSLPIIVGGRYGILIGANIALTQSLTVTRPLSLQGTSQAITLFGSGSVRNGLLLGATAGNSLVRDLTFAGFADDAIRLTDNTNTSILGLRVRDSGYGLTVTGTSTGTVAQGNVFNRNATGVRLLSATGVLIGGSVAGQGNTISNATREGVFAQGFCTNSRVVRNTITGTAVPYNTSQSRNLTVVP
jgi:hypothetical protein